MGTLSQYYNLRQDGVLIALSHLFKYNAWKCHRPPIEGRQTYGSSC